MASLPYLSKKIESLGNNLVQIAQFYIQLFLHNTNVKQTLKTDKLRCDNKTHNEDFQFDMHSF